MHYSNLIAAYRKTWALTQAEVGAFIGLTGDAIGTYELDKSLPSLAGALALELLFGQPAAKLFPDLFHAVADRVLSVAAEFSVEIEGLTDEVSAKKRELLAVLSERLARILPEA